MGVEEQPWILLSRPGCHLCEVMEEQTRTALGGEGDSLRVVCVDDDEDHRARWGDSIPVLLRDGVPVAKIRTDPRTLKRIIRRRR